ncbi:MAG TPA: hypothetical protein VG941_02480 [Candidatus Paceibacterota bacterium]|nr:hypothetical protein [Candidatus Paceibacterota bacterium]
MHPTPEMTWLVAVLAAIAVGYGFKKRQEMIAEIVTERSQTARDIAASLWKADRVLHQMDGWVLVFMNHQVRPKRIALVVPPHHDDFDRFRGVRRGDVLDLQALAEPSAGGKIHELASYLRFRH